jgi:transcriptional regulator with XRE-family HTH domain
MRRRQSRLLEAPPYPVEHAIQTLGANLRTARLRRNLTVEEVAEKIGANRKTILDAEKGKPSTNIATYTAMLWTLGLLGQLEDVADPALDKEGSVLARSRERQHARKERAPDNDF